MLISCRQFLRASRHEALIPSTISTDHNALHSARRGSCLRGSTGGQSAPHSSSRAGRIGRVRQAGSRSAFALIEVLIGSGLLGVMSVSLYLAIAQGLAFVQIARENLRATQILQEKLETIRLYNWDQINQTDFIPPAFTNYYFPSGSPGNQGAVYRGTTTLADAPVGGSYASNMKLVSVQLTWTSSNVQRQRSMQTFVSRYGLQNYVYPLK